MKVCNTPSDWILEECYPEGFAWADPSKIHKSEVFRLLDHWRQCEKDGLTPLIWNRSCELFDDGEICSRTIGIKKRKEACSSSASPDGSLPSSPDPIPILMRRIPKKTSVLIWQRFPAATLITQSLFPVLITNPHPHPPLPDTQSQESQKAFLHPSPIPHPVIVGLSAC